MKRIFLIVLLTSACSAYAMEDEEWTDVFYNSIEKTIIADLRCNIFSVRMAKNISNGICETIIYEFVDEKGWHIIAEGHPWVDFMIRNARKKIAEKEKELMLEAKK